MFLRNQLLSSLAERDAEVLYPRLREVFLTKGETIAESGNHVSHVYFPSSAVLSVVVALSDGREVEVATLGMEGASGLLEMLSGEPATTRMFVQIPGSAFRTPADALRRQALDSPELMRTLLLQVKAAGAQAEQNVACNTLHDAPARLAKWLLMTEDRTGGATFPLTQEYMAIMLGVQRTTVNAAAVELRNRRLIQYSRGSVRVLDRPGLEGRACECYGVLRERADYRHKVAPSAAGQSAAASGRMVDASGIGSGDA